MDLKFYIGIIILIVILTAIAIKMKFIRNEIAIILSSLGIIVTIIIAVFPPEPDSGFGPTPIPTDTSVQTTEAPSTPAPTAKITVPSNPQSPYVKALKKELAGDASYSDEKKMDFILDTYDTRKDDSGENQEWYHSTPIYDETTGYNLAVYYADDMPFFIDVRTNGEGVLKLYYWGDELLMCYDKRGSSRVESYKGSEIYQAVAEEFAHVYELACKAA